MDRYNLTVVVPSLSNEHDDLLDKYLRNKAFTHEYWNAFLPPHKRVIVFKYFDENMINNVKQWFKETYKNHPNANVCSFQVASVERYQV